MLSRSFQSGLYWGNSNRKMRLKKRRKSSRFRGSHTHGRGFKKKARGSGHRGGKGLAGTGKRGDQRKTLILNLYGKNYFGKNKTLRKKPVMEFKVINIQTILNKLPSFIKTGKAKEIKDLTELNLKGYKILGEGQTTNKLKITASAASKSAIEKIKKAGGEILIQKKF